MCIRDRDALDDKEYTGSLVTLLQAGTDFVRNNSKKAWRKVGDGRIEMPDYPDRAVLEGVVNALIHRNYMEIKRKIKKMSNVSYVGSGYSGHWEING